MKIHELGDKAIVKLINNRWSSSESVWNIVNKTYDENLRIYKNEPRWLTTITRKQSKVRANRIFRDMESVINSLIANPPKPIILTSRNTPEARELAGEQEQYFVDRYNELNVKEDLRKGLRNLYYGRLIVLKPFWNNKINDFDVKSVNPKDVRFNKRASCEQESEFAIEEITDSAVSLINRFPKKKDELLRKMGLTEEKLLTTNPEIKYKEAWLQDHVYFEYKNVLLGRIRNPYWDWDGLLVTEQEEEELADLGGEERTNKLNEIRGVQGERAPKEGEEGSEQSQFQAYFFNHFDNPRKPYIFATIFNNENSPVGQTDMITQAAPLQEGVDKRKRDIDLNAELVNGIIKVDSGVMTNAEAQKLRFGAKGIVYGKGVITGVQRETGTPLPNFVFDDMKDSRSEIDNIMAASSAFRGEREGQETKGGRLALIEQSFLNLNELVQVVDFVSLELFNWFYQLAKVRYTEHHYSKKLGTDSAQNIVTLIQDDFEDGTEIRVISGKTLPEDRAFRFEMAQEDVKNGFISPLDYLEIAGYDSPQEKAKNKVMYDINAPAAVGITDEELIEVAPPPPPEEEVTPPPV